ncbi:MAG TPA: 2-succinyl-5-enolpyruvyl-6-hydroxy-3-cyclohexene-1-carboxylic-acid synthase [Bacteroidales bacterium]|nr:2-succinyl-5-enolpyruvyl-6-hydroxy-3-cyclohexene-1-carboxylic-acid synthase [Bacteroidales bacterium]
MRYRGKESLVQLAGLLAAKGVSTAIVSPGSRNAPVIAALNRQEGIKCLSIVDERSAAFFALGIAQQTRKPVVISCTSGTAALNYAPAIAEAYYQQIPLIVLTADRPPEWIDQGDGQTIRQQDLYANYIRKSVQLPSEPWSENSLHYNARLINEAIDAATFPVCGPVHINIPLNEPLYEESEKPQVKFPVMELIKTCPQISKETFLELANIWNHAGSKLVITGSYSPKPELNSLLNQLAEDETVAVFTETISNLSGKYFFPHIDRLIDGLEHESQDNFTPDLLITLGGNIVSRKVKAWLQKHKSGAHWHIATGDFHMNTFRNLTQTIPMDAAEFFSYFIENINPANGNYRQLWLDRQAAKTMKHNAYIRQCKWSDLKAFRIILEHIPGGTMIQAGNSTPVRYLQLFDFPANTTCFGNRGVSGIDGCMSTAAGAAWANPALTVLITGDVAFMYDSNALWNPNLTPNLRIIVMNNGGGNIFRIIDGPDTMPELERFIETPHIPQIQHLANVFGLDYYVATDESELQACLPVFLDKSMMKPAIFEVKTSNKTSAAVLREYFKYLRS